MGAKIRQLRNGLGLTISDLAKGTELSSSLISQVERGVAEPSLGSLRRIADVLGVPVATLFVGGDDNPSDSSNSRGERLVVRADARRILKAPDSDMLHELLVPDLSSRVLELVQTQLPPKSRMPDDVAQHAGEESIIVLEGQIVAVHDNDEFVLRAGDTISWDPSIPHWIENRGSEPATVIGVVTPPTF
ncbi:MAG: XRE family transcriptional regulator [Actinomycetota bacterium]